MEEWKSPRRLREEEEAAYIALQEERRKLRMQVGTALADCVLDKVIEPSEAKKFYRKQFPEVTQ